MYKSNFVNSLILKIVFLRMYLLDLCRLYFLLFQCEFLTHKVTTS